MTIGGTQRVCYNLINWICNHTDASVHLIIYSKRQVGKVAYDLSKVSHSYASGNMRLRISILRKELKRIKPDLLISMGTPCAMYDVPACAGLGIKHIISERNDPSHFAGKPTTRILSRLLMRFADGYVFQTKDAQMYYGGKMASHSVIIPNPLFNTEDMPTMQYGGVETKTIVSVGRLNKQKNYPFLIRSFKEIHSQYPEYNLIIYGDGPERQNLETVIKDLGINDVVLLPGAVNNIPEVIYSASLFVLPSDFEGMPNALMEAMALGLPCISTDCPCGGARELIENKKNGLLIPLGDEHSLVSAIMFMLNSREKAKQMGMNAMEIRRTHSLDVISKLWYDYFCLITK